MFLNKTKEIPFDIKLFIENFKKYKTYVGIIKIYYK